MFAIKKSHIVVFKCDNRETAFYCNYSINHVLDLKEFSLRNPPVITTDEACWMRAYLSLAIR